MSPPAAKPMSPRRRVAGFPSRPADDDVAEDSKPANIEPAAEVAAADTASANGANKAVTAAAATDARTQSDADGRAAPDRIRARPTGGESAPLAEGDVSQPGGFRHQTNFRLYDSEMSYLRRLKRDFEDDDVRTDITELVHALVYTARRGELDTLEILRRWRKDLNEF